MYALFFFNFNSPSCHRAIILVQTRHVFVKHRCPRQQQSQNMAKISKSYILTPPHPKGHVMSVNCEEPIDELTVQVWLLYDHPNIKQVSGTELWTNGRTDNPITRCPRRAFQAGGIKISLYSASFRQSDLLSICWSLNDLPYLLSVPPADPLYLAVP